MTTRRPAKAAQPAQPETPGTAEPDAAVPGTSQDAPEPVHEPALDEAAEAAPAEAESGTEAEALELYDFAEHGRRVLAPWPSVAPPRVLTADAEKAWRAAEGAIAQSTVAALAEADRAHRAALEHVHGRLDDWLLMRTQRFPQHAA